MVEVKVSWLNFYRLTNQKTARQIKDPNEAIDWLISIVNSPFQRAKLLNNVQGVCGLLEPDLEVILKEVKQMERSPLVN